MDFGNFKAAKQANSVSSSFLVEGQEQDIKKTKEAVGFFTYPFVYQGCDTCKTERRHYILDNVVTCLGCKNSYKLVPRTKTN